MKLLLFIFSHLCFLLLRGIQGQTDKDSSSGRKMEPDRSIRFDYDVEKKFHDYNVLKDGSTRRWDELSPAKYNELLPKFKYLCKDMFERREKPAIRIACSYKAFVGGSRALLVKLKLVDDRRKFRLDILRCDCWEEKHKKKTTQPPFYIAAYKDSQYFRMVLGLDEHPQILTITNLLPANYPNYT